MELEPNQIPDFQEDNMVATGHIGYGVKNGVIRSTPLGSCVAVVAYDKSTKIGGIAHIMLPGRSPNDIEENKYAENGIVNLLEALIGLGAVKTKIEICLVGGANVLKRKDDSIAKNIVSDVVSTIEQMKLPIIRISVGGTERYSAALNLKTGVVNYTVGDSDEKILCEYLAKNY